MLCGLYYLNRNEEYCDAPRVNFLWWAKMWIISKINFMQVEIASLFKSTHKPPKNKDNLSKNQKV
jgi:hypothetical protein